MKKFILLDFDGVMIPSKTWKPVNLINDGKEKQKRYGKKILQLDLDDNLINEFNSIREASEKTGIDRKSISNCAKGVKHYNTAGVLNLK